MYIVQFNMVNENLYPSSYFILNYIIAEMSREHVIQRENDQFSFPVGLGIRMSKLERDISLAEQYFVQRFLGDLSHLK